MKREPKLTDKQLKYYKQLEAAEVYIDDYMILCQAIVIKAIDDYTQYGVEGDSKQEIEIFENAKDWLFNEDIIDDLTSLNTIARNLNIAIEKIRQIAKEARAKSLAGEYKQSKTKFKKGEVKAYGDVDAS